jgi:hypothetical protein
LAAPPRIGAITPRHSWPIFGNAAGELNSPQRTTPSLLRTPVTVIDSFPGRLRQASRQRRCKNERRSSSDLRAE